VSIADELSAASWLMSLPAGTRNVLSEQRDGKIAEAFEGIDELFEPAQPSLMTCELVRALRASKPEEKPHAADRELLSARQTSAAADLHSQL